MFGYIIFNKPELRFRDYDDYKACYCGICKSLKKNYGLRGQISLNYDAVFLTLLLTGLYEPENICERRLCILHPLKKHNIVRNIYSEYSADMSLYLTFYKCMDDWKDDKKITRLLYASSLKRKAKYILKQYPDKCGRITKELEKLSVYEKDNSYDIDKVSGCFGNIMAEIYAYENDIWEKSLRKIGFYIGKFIYIIDAYDDIESDIKNGSYNVLKGRYEAIFSKDAQRTDNEKKFTEECYRILSMMMAECSKEFEKLPVIMYSDLLRNILYSGVWCRFGKKCNDKEK